MLDVPELLLDERRRQGLDVFDEVWKRCCTWCHHLRTSISAWDPS